MTTRGLGSSHQYEEDPIANSSFMARSDRLPAHLAEDNELRRKKEKRSGKVKKKKKKKKIFFHIRRLSL